MLGVSRHYISLVIAILLTVVLLGSSAIVGRSSFVDGEEGVPISFSVVDLDGSSVIGCKPVKVAESIDQSGPYNVIGSYGNGDVVQGELEMWYRFTPDGAPACPGYEFDHWEILVYSAPQSYGGMRLKISSLIGVSLTDPSDTSPLETVNDWDAYAYTDYAEYVSVTLYLRKKTFTLDISVDPPYSGSTTPIPPGVHEVDAGKTIDLFPVAYSGYEFDHWTIDGADTGSINSPTLFIVMNSDHEVVAHFRKSGGGTQTQTETVTETHQAPSKAAASSNLVICPLPSQFPYSAKYKGMQVDLQFNEDLLRRLAGKAAYYEKENVILLGGPLAEPQPWEKLGAHLKEDHLVLDNIKYYAKYGHKDYGIIYMSCQDGRGFTAWVAGITRYGTRAALMWMLNNPDELSGKMLIVVQWIDTNWNLAVDPSEIRVIKTIP